MDMRSLKIQAPANIIEHCVDWQVASMALARENTEGDGFGLAVLVLINPKLSEAMAGEQEDLDKEEIAAQVLHLTREAVGGFMGFGAEDR